MEDIIRHFSDAAIDLFGGVAIIVIFTGFMSHGILHQVFEAFMTSVCG